MASYRDKLPATGVGSSPTFQRGVYTWSTSTNTTVTIPITTVDPSHSFVTHLRASTGAAGQWDEVTFTGKLNATGTGIEIVRSGTVARNLTISWEVCTDAAATVQRGVRVFTSENNVDITITTLSDLTKASARLVGVPQSYTTSTTATPWTMMVRCELQASLIRLSRSATSTPVQVSWEVVSYV